MPKKVYHKFTSFDKGEAQKMKGFCTNTFECNGINFEVLKYKGSEYICFNYYCVSKSESVESFKSNIILHDYSESKINSWIKTQLETVKN